MTNRTLNSQCVPVAHSHKVKLCTNSESETLNLGATLAEWLHAGDVILLHGDLGAGKTVLAKGIARGLGVNAPVTSPSFALVNEYALSPDSLANHLSHLDLYRLNTLDDLETIGFADIVTAPTAITLIEWPERALGALPDRYLLVEIDARGDETRDWSISGTPDDAAWRARLNDLNRRIREVSKVVAPR